jgi:uncharacterized membrane protein
MKNSSPLSTTKVNFWGKIHVFEWLTFAFIAIYTLAAILVSVHRFWQFEVFYYDFGIFDQALWHAAHFRLPVIDHFVIPGKIIFADHFGPSLFLYAPIYWLTDKPEAMLITQAIIVGLSALVLFFIAKQLKLQKILSLAAVVCYLMFIGTQNALISDIHDVTFMMLPMMLMMYGIISKRKLLFWIFFFITLGFKESTGLLAIAAAMFIFFYNHTWRKTAVLVAIIGIAWSYTTTQLIIPYFYGRRYFYTPILSANPLVIAWGFIDDPVKRKTIVTSLLSFGFLPIFYPPAWPMILQDWATRFLEKDFPLRWTTGLHYNTQMAVILSVSTLLAIKKHALILNTRNSTILALALILLSLYLHQIALHGPLGLSYNRAFYQHTKNFSFLTDLISNVPMRATVMTMNNIAPHMIHTHKVYLLRAVYDDFLPEYFVLDLRDGQNFNNFFGANIDALLLTLPNDERYEIFYKSGDQIIYKRK